MRVAVLGAGAIGAYVGASLQRGGADVTVIARGEHLRAMQQDGIQVLSERGAFTARPEATDDIARIADADVVFLGLKAYSLPALATEIASHLAAGADVVTAQNGVPWWLFHHWQIAHEYPIENVDPGGVISRSLDSRHVIGCAVYSSTEILRPGVIRHIEGTRFAIGRPDGRNDARCVTFADAMTAGGLKCMIAPDLRAQLWLKLIGNVAFNPMSVLCRATLGEFGLIEESVRLARAILEEGAAVGAKMGLQLPVAIERRLQAGIAVGDHKTSMLQDFEAGKPLELDCMTGAVLELARDLDVPTPHTFAVDACVRLLVRERQTREATA